MSFLDIAKKRYTVRSYTSQKVEQDKLDQILEAPMLPRPEQTVSRSI